jgi:predicted amidohydrolase
MKLLLLQTDIVWNDPQANFQKASRLIASADTSGLDLIVLPEMFSTGFATRPAGIAEKEGAQALEWMKSTAASTDAAAVVGSVAVEDGGKFYNRMFFVKPDGEIIAYDKRHLFSYAGEHKEYSAGSDRVVVEWRGWRILLQVCYDLRFPVFARSRGDYDMIVYSANWPTVRIDAWNTLLKARAIENLCYVAGVNRVGSDPSVAYSGGTWLFDYKGKTVAADQAVEQAIVAEADLEALRAFRRKFPAADDSDDFVIKK